MEQVGSVTRDRLCIASCVCPGVLREFSVSLTEEPGPAGGVRAPAWAQQTFVNVFTAKAAPVKSQPVLHAL